MNNQLYIVEYPPDSKYAEDAPLISEKFAPQYDDTQRTRCPICGRAVSGGLWLQPRHVALTSRRLPDFLYTYSDQVPFLLSERALIEIQKAGLSGIIKAEAIDHLRYLRKSKKDIPIPNYYHIEVARSRITANREHSKIKYSTNLRGDPCPLCKPIPATWMAAKELVYHMEQYEGYDIFHTYEQGNTLFVSRRFVEFCQKKKLTNFHCCLASEWELGVFAEGAEKTNLG